MDLIISDQPHGAQFSLVAYVVQYDNGILTCKGLSPQQDFTIGGAPNIQAGLYTIYDVMRSQEDCDCITVPGETEFHVHQPKREFQNVTIIDLRSGMGGFSIGSNLLGMRTSAFVERSALACDALRANFTCPVIEGDLGDMQTLKQLHVHRGNDFLQITGGFPCQGFSSQGDQMGMEDHRSHSLTYILQAAWFLQADSVLLECVANVVNFPCAQECIDHYASLAKMHTTKQVFDLQAQWPVRRNRYWCHLLRQDLPCIDIPVWHPSPCFRTLGDIMPLDAIWSDLEEQQLEWDPSELAIYLDPSFGTDSRTLQADAKAPTVLHSWGHVNRPCPCGCRAAFSMLRLRRGGARGFGLISARSGKYRHLHHEEGALLCTVPPTYRFPMPPRAALSLLGQIAAPLQVLWVQAHILAGLQQHFWGWTRIAPCQVIYTYQCALAAHALTRWITPSMYHPRMIQLYLEDMDIWHEIKIDTPVTVGQLLAAEKSLSGWGHYAIVTHQGNRLHSEVLLLPNIAYTVKHCVSKQVRPFPAVLPIFGGGPAGGEEHEQLGDRLIWTFMQAMISKSTAVQSHPCPFVLYPFRARDFLMKQIPNAVAYAWQQRFLRASCDVYLICELHGHWIFLHGLWTQQGRGLQWTLYDGLRQGQTLPWMFQVTRKLTDLLQAEHLGLFVAQGLRQLHSNTCGTIALLHLAQHLQLLEGTSHTEIAEMHAWLLSLDFGISYIYGGGPDESQRQLAALLATKGVPTSAADERAKMIFNKLGHKKLQTILKAKNVWAELKSAASQPGIMFRLVTMEEQKHYIAERAKSKHGAQISNHRAKKALKNKAHEVPLHLDPNQFDLDANHFKDENDLPVPQLAYTDVETEARGVALCTLDMAHHFLEQTNSISTDALALLFVDVHDADLIANSGLKPIVIPAKFKGTGETTLIYGHILQIGDLQVSRESASQDSSPDVIDTKVIKIQVFRDQFTADWNRFADAPVRTLIAAMESLQLCKGAQCGAACNKLHPGLDETIDNMIFELWARSFFDDSGRKTTSDHASLFTVFMRVPEGALHKIMLGTPQGVYVEPRGSQPREHDANYKIVWLPGATAETAAHQCRTYDKALFDANEDQIWHQGQEGG